MKKITRKDAIRIFDRATDRDDPFWENLFEDFYEDDEELPPSPEDVFNALGVSREEYQSAVHRGCKTGAEHK